MSGDGWIRGPQWASPAAQAEWGDRIEAAAAAWDELELLSITAGARASALRFLTPADICDATAAAQRVGLAVLPLSWDGGSLRAAICLPKLADRWLKAWRGGDDREIGRLLGFPECCIEFFHETWVGRGVRDTTGAMLQADGGDGPPEANILLRRLGIRLVPHLPCSFSCWGTVELARQMIDVADACGLEDVGEVLQILGLPMSWNSANGAAVVNVADMFRFTYESDRRYLGAFKRQGVLPRQLDPPTWRDNGFRSRAAMDRAHGIVAAVAGDCRSGIDLGAGDGALLDRIAARSSVAKFDIEEASWVAVEADLDRAMRGATRRPRVQFAGMRIEDYGLSAHARADVALLMPGRVLEMEPSQAESFRERVPSLADRLVVYSYDGGLEQMFARSGLAGALGPIQAAPGVEAAEVICQ